VLQTEVPQYTTRNTQRAIRGLLPLLSIVALGGFLRLYHIGSKGLWLDEAFSVWLGWQPVGEMLGWLVRIDQHPPLYYTLLHFWMALLGDDPAAARALSAMCGTLTIPVIYLLGRRLADEKVGLLAALILAVSPFHVRFAQEARMYTLLALNVSLALYALARLLTDPRSAKIRLGQQFADFQRTWRATRRRPPLRTIETDLAWLAYVVFTVATLLTHNTAIFFPIATNVLVLLLPRLRITSHESRITNTEYRIPTFCATGSWPNSACSCCGSPGSRPSSSRAWASTASSGCLRRRGGRSPAWCVVGAFVSDFLPLPFAGLCAVGALYVGLALLGLAYFCRRPARVAFLLVIFVTPFVGEWLVSLRRPIFYTRTLIWASIPLYLLLAAGMRRLRRWPYVIAVVLVALAVNGLSLREYYAHSEKEQWDDAAALVAEQVQPDDLILFNATWVQIPFDYYFHRLYNCPAAEHGVPVDLFDRGVLEPRMAAGDLPRLRALIRDRERVWLVYSHDWYTDPRGLIPSALEEELDLLDRWDFYGLQVRLYKK